jgi:hypothetical protein
MGTFKTRLRIDPKGNVSLSTAGVGIIRRQETGLGIGGQVIGVGIDGPKKADRSYLVFTRMTDLFGRSINIRHKEKF